MDYIYKIFEKATIRGVADYLLFGLGPEEDDRSYEERMDALYDKFENVVRKYDTSPTSELLDLSNELTSETASVYTEIGIQIGMMLAMDMLQNIKQGKNSRRRGNCRNKESEKIMDQFYHMQRRSMIEETLLKDSDYQQTDQAVQKAIMQLDNLKTDTKLKEAVQEIFEKQNKKWERYGVAAYRQGFSDATHILT